MSSEFDGYSSQFSWRYGSPAMRRLWGEAHRRKLWRHIWVKAAEMLAQFGVATPEQVADLEAHVNDIDMHSAVDLEKHLRDEVLAEAHVFAAQCPIGGSLLLLDAASSDVAENADVLCMREALDMLIQWLGSVLNHLAQQIEVWADTPTVAYTHLQPSEPTTVGYRLAQYGQDLLIDLQELKRVRDGLRGKGFKGPVGTSAMYAQLISDAHRAAEFESSLMSQLGLEAFPVSGQAYPRKQDWLVASALGSLASSLYKLAYDLRLLQTAFVGEWSSPMSADKADASFIPFRKQPIGAERVNSLARLVGHLLNVTWDNASHSLYEYSQDDAANRREVLPLMFLALDEMLIITQRLTREMTVDLVAVQTNLERYGPFATVGRLHVELVRAGADHEQTRELLRHYSITAWNMIADGAPNPLIDALSADDTITAYLSGERIRALMNVNDYVGDAPLRARRFAAAIRSALPPA